MQCACKQGKTHNPYNPYKNQGNVGRHRSGPTNAGPPGVVPRCPVGQTRGADGRCRPAPSMANPGTPGPRY